MPISMKSISKLNSHDVDWHDLQQWYDFYFKIIHRDHFFFKNTSRCRHSYLCIQFNKKWGILMSHLQRKQYLNLFLPSLMCSTIFQFHHSMTSSNRLYIPSDIRGMIYRQDQEFFVHGFMLIYEECLIPMLLEAGLRATASRWSFFPFINYNQLFFETSTSNKEY